MDASRTQAGIYKMNLEYVMVPESKEVPKQETKPTLIGVCQKKKKKTQKPTERANGHSWIIRAKQ